MRALTVTEFYKLGFSFRPVQSSSLIELVFPVVETNSNKVSWVSVAVFPPAAGFSEILEVSTEAFRDWAKTGEDTWRGLAERVGILGEVV